MTGREPIDARAVRERIDLAGLVRTRGVMLKERSGKLSGCCPFHKESTPSFFVYPQPRPGHFHCFGCGAHGDAIDFVMQLDGLGFREAVHALGGPQVLTARDRERIAAREAEARRREAKSREAKTANAVDLWIKAGPAAGTPVESYLRGRAIDLAAIGGIPAALRCGLVDYWWEDPRVHPGAPRSERFRILAKLPAMVAAVQGPDGGLIAAHVTWLQKRGDGSWGKAELADPLTGEILSAKKILGPYFGGAIRLVPTIGPTLRGGEGIETCLTFLGALRRGGRGDPVWCLGSLGNFAGGAVGKGPKKPGTREEVVSASGRTMVRWQRRPSPMPDMSRPGFVPPKGVQRFGWIGDSDGKDPEDGRLTVERGLARYRRLGVDPFATWAAPGMDFNDMARGKAA